MSGVQVSKSYTPSVASSPRRVCVQRTKKKRRVGSPENRKSKQSHQSDGHACTHHQPIRTTEMAAAALQEAPPEAEAEAFPRVTFASTLEVGLYVRWRRALDGEDAMTMGASAAEEAARDRWWQEIVREYTSPVRR